ncbi:MAG: hypothetical protein AB2693_31450 [Candidatus Thiodiazotropha sp.]
MFIKAVWLEGKKEMEGVIPSTWLRDKTVMWPPGVDAAKAFEEQAAPNERWRAFHLVKVKHRSGM